MYQLAVLVALVFCVAAATVTDPDPSDGCATVTSSNGNTIILCNGTAGTAGPTTGPKGTGGCCQPECTARASGPVGIPVQEPVKSPANLPTISSSNILTRFVWDPIMAVINGIFNTVTEILMRAISYSISKIIDVLVVGAMAYGINKFVVRVKGGWATTTAAAKAEPPIVPAFPGTGYSLVA